MKKTGALKIILYVAASFLLAVFQSTVGKRMGLFGTTAQMTLALTVCAAYFHGPTVGAVCGIASGVFTEAIGSTGIAILPLFYMFAGWIVGIKTQEAEQKHRTAGFLRYSATLALSCLFGSLVTVIMTVLNAAKPHLLQVILHIALPEALNTFIFGILLGLAHLAFKNIARSKGTAK